MHERPRTARLAHHLANHEHSRRPPNSGRITVPGTRITVGPNKRPLNNVCPPAIRLPNRAIPLGLRGGRPIVNVAATSVAELQHGATGLEAITAPRLDVEEQDPIEVTAT